MKYGILSLIIGLILIAGAFLIIQKGNVSPFEVSKFQELIDTNQIGENDYEVFDKSIDDLIKSGQIDAYLNTSSIVIFLITAGLGLFLFFIGIHSILDKLFFKKFFEKPNYKVAIRRSILFTGTIIGIAVLRFYRLEWNSVVLIFPFVLIVELTIIYFFSSSKSEEIDKKEEEIDQEHDTELSILEEAIEQSFDSEVNNVKPSIVINEETHIGEEQVQYLKKNKNLDDEIEEIAEEVEESNLEEESEDKVGI